MKTGKLMPVNPEAVMVIEAEGLTGKEAFVTDEGDLIRGRRALPEEEDKGLPVGFVPHWAIEELLVSDVVLHGDEHAEKPALPADDINKVHPPDVREEELHTA